MAQRESQLVAEGLAGPVPLVEDVPASLLPTARLDVLFGYGARAADGGLNAKCLDKGRPAHQPCIHGHRLLLKGSGGVIIDYWDYWVDFQGPRSKTPLFGRKLPII